MLEIKDIKYDREAYGGCETCDYGSRYISDMEITLKDDQKIKIETEQMYEYMLSEADYMNALSNSNTLDELIVNILKIVSAKSYDIERRISLQSMIIKVNEIRIDILKTLEKGRIMQSRNNRG
jgi:hypothetical protein